MLWWPEPNKIRWPGKASLRQWKKSVFTTSMSWTQLTFWALFPTILYIFSNTKQFAVLPIHHVISRLCACIRSVLCLQYLLLLRHCLPSSTSLETTLLYSFPKLWPKCWVSYQEASPLCYEHASISAYATLYSICFTLTLSY